MSNLPSDKFNNVKNPSSITHTKSLPKIRPQNKIFRLGESLTKSYLRRQRLFYCGEKPTTLKIDLETLHEKCLENQNSLPKDHPWFSWISDSTTFPKKRVQNCVSTENNSEEINDEGNILPEKK